MRGLNPQDGIWLWIQVDCRECCGCFLRVTLEEDKRRLRCSMTVSSDQSLADTLFTTALSRKKPTVACVEHSPSRTDCRSLATLTNTQQQTQCTQGSDEHTNPPPTKRYSSW